VLTLVSKFDRQLRLIKNLGRHKNHLKNTKKKVQSLEVMLWEVKAGGQELKQVMKETVDSECTISQKLAYEK
jgi:hypothetical protein